MLPFNSGAGLSLVSVSLILSSLLFCPALCSEACLWVSSLVFVLFQSYQSSQFSQLSTIMDLVLVSRLRRFKDLSFRCLASNT